MFIMSDPYPLVIPMVYPPASSKRNHQEIIGLTEVYLRRWTPNVSERGVVIVCGVQVHEGAED